MFRLNQSQTSNAVSNFADTVADFLSPSTGQTPALAGGATTATAPGPLSQRRRRRLRRLAGIEGRRF